MRTVRCRVEKKKRSPKSPPSLKKETPRIGSDPASSEFWKGDEQKYAPSA